MYYLFVNKKIFDVAIFGKPKSFTVFLKHDFDDCKILPFSSKRFPLLHCDVSFTGEKYFPAPATR